MDVQALSTLSRIEQTAPPPPIRRPLQMPTEPLLFAAVVLMVTLAIAKALPQAGAAEAASQAPTVVVHAHRA